MDEHSFVVCYNALLVRLHDIKDDLQKAESFKDKEYYTYLLRDTEKAIQSFEAEFCKCSGVVTVYEARKSIETFLEAQKQKEGKVE